MKLQMENEHLWQELEENKRDLYHLQKENQELKESILQHIQRDITHMKTVVKTISKPPVESLD
jgi:ribosomal protein L29